YEVAVLLVPVLCVPARGEIALSGFALRAMTARKHPRYRLLRGTKQPVGLSFGCCLTRGYGRKKIMYCVYRCYLYQHFVRWLCRRCALRAMTKENNVLCVPALPVPAQGEIVLSGFAVRVMTDRKTPHVPSTARYEAACGNE